MQSYAIHLASFRRLEPDYDLSALRIYESTVDRHRSDYALSEKLKPENGGSQSLLSDTQTMQLFERLSEKTYFYTRQIITYIEAELDGKAYHRSEMVRNAGKVL